VDALLDTLTTPSTDGADKVYHHLKGILDITAMQQVEISFQPGLEINRWRFLFSGGLRS
jgi:hypothetical protein